jgi:hypothetical protein
MMRELVGRYRTLYRLFVHTSSALPLGLDVWSEDRGGDKTSIPRITH